jgi:hypothetical protein
MKVTFDGIGEKHEVDLDSKSKTMYVKWSLLCSFAPFIIEGIPLVLNMAITPQGDILKRGFNWKGNASYYLELSRDISSDLLNSFEVTPRMKETVEGLFSGRIKFMDFNVPVGKTVQRAVGGISLEDEEKRLGKKIFLQVPCDNKERPLMPKTKINKTNRAKRR